MDPDQNKTPDQNVPIPETSTVPETSNSYMDNVNKPQTPAFNDTDYWNQKPEEPKANITEPVNPPEPLGQSEPETPASTEPTPASTETPSQGGPEPEVSTVAAANDDSQPTDPAYQKWDDPPTPSETTTPSEPVSPPPSVLEPTKSNTLTVVMVVLVALLLGATALFAFQNSQLKKQTTATPQPSQTLESLATPDPYADWKTFTSTKANYSFKYPGTWPLTNIPTAKGCGICIESLHLGQSDTLKTPDSDIATILVFKDPRVKTLDDYKKLYIDNDSTKIEIKNTTIGGETAISYKLSGGIPPLPVVEYVVVNKDHYFLITLVDSTETKKSLTLNQQTFDQVLSTFSFNSTSASPSGSPVSLGTCEKGFKAFANNDISLCYPETLKLTTADTNASVLVFDNGNQTLKVTKNFQGGWGGSQCLFIDKTTVSGYASKRLSWKTEQATGGGCDNTFTAFAEMVNEGNFKFPFPYALELTAKKAPFQDNSQFLTIEKSFQLKNPNPTPNGS